MRAELYLATGLLGIGLGVVASIYHSFEILGVGYLFSATSITLNFVMARGK